MIKNRATEHGIMSFTLVEIMVAVGMLMLIMSFLFQFVLGSQRLWSASDHTGQVFDNAQLVMDMLGQDVRNMSWSNKVGVSRPFYYAENVAGLTFEDEKIPSVEKMFMFITQSEKNADKDSLTFYPVVYVLVGDMENNSNNVIKSLSYTLFRVILSKTVVDASLPESKKVLTMDDLENIRKYPFIDFSDSSYGKDNSNYSLIKSLVEKLTKINLREEDILMNDISGFDWDVYTNFLYMKYIDRNENAKLWTSFPKLKGYFLKEMPFSFRVKLNVFCMDAVNGNEWEELKDPGDRLTLLRNKYERSFTKRFFLGNITAQGYGLAGNEDESP